MSRSIVVEGQLRGKTLRRGFRGIIECWLSEFLESKCHVVERKLRLDAWGLSASTTESLCLDIGLLGPRDFCGEIGDRRYR